MLTQTQIAALMTDLGRELEAKSTKLVPWFADNKARIRTLTQMLTVLVGRMPADLSLRQIADSALEEAQKLVTAKLPAQQGWFETNKPLLRLISLRIRKALEPASEVRASPNFVSASEQTNRSALADEMLSARVEPVLFSVDPPADLDAVATQRAGDAERIGSFLKGQGVEPGGDAATVLLARLEPDVLAERMRQEIYNARARQNRALEQAAAEIARINETDSKLSPSTMVFGLPAAGVDLSRPGRVSAVSMMEALNQALQRQASASAAAVAGFIVFLRHFRPELLSALAERLQGEGTLNSTWTTVVFPDGGELPLRAMDPPRARIVLGAKLAEFLRVVTPRPSASAEATAIELSTPGPAAQPDLWSAAARTEANLAAITLLARSGPYCAAEVETLKRYSGWGGLSIDKIRTRVPSEWLPEERGLIHEYYTPSAVAAAIADAIKPRLLNLEDGNGRVSALEPSAGIGRFIRALSGDGFDSLRWTACEYSRISAALLRAIRPDVEVFAGSFEEWVQANLDRRGHYQLVISNPPYGERGAAATLDPDRSYRDKQAYVYQLRRSLEFLATGGIGVYLIPAGFLTGRGARSIELRRKILLMAHLMAAFRLPSETEEGKPLFPGALLVTDILFFRARGGLLPEVVVDDQEIVAGRYFELNPLHILGKEVGKESGDQDQTRKPRWGYQVRGRFTSLPAFEERPICRDCAPILFDYERSARQEPVDLDEGGAEALQLARRISRYFADIARGDEEATVRAKAAHAELRQAVLSWHAQDASAKLRVAGLLKRVPEFQPLFSALTTDGKLVSALDTPPSYTAKFLGNPDDIPAMAAYLHGDSQATLASIASFHASLGGQKTAALIKAELAAAGFAFDQGRIFPPNEYYSGALWERYDRARAAAESGDDIAAAQAAKLLEQIRPANYSDLQVEPRLGWLPVEVIGAFLRYYASKHHYDDVDYQVERSGPFLTLRDVPYDLLPYRAKEYVYEFLGYVNHDFTYFKPDREGKENTDQARERRAAFYKEQFIEWLESSAGMQRLVVDAFNRLYRGWVPPTYPKEPVMLVRWNDQKPLYGYQWAGVRRLNANHGGGLFYAVGLGKTRTLLASLALARQQGWARRPAICAPNSVIFNWLAEMERVLPDYRPVLIGAKRKSIQRGARKGEIESETDSPRERADKWERFKAGLYDVALITYSALPRTKMRAESVLEIVRSTPALAREIGLGARGVETRIRQLEKRKKLSEEQQEELSKLRQNYADLSVTERRAAIQKEQEEAFVAEILELPEGWEADPGIYWEDLGIDWIALDEAHIAKNLWTVGPREGGALKFLGAPQSASTIAYQCYFRTALVRKQAGGAGIHLGDATPAKNSPLEFLSLLSLIDGNVWDRLGILDSEQYVTQFLKIEKKLVTDLDLSIVEAPCVVGFQNLDQLREVLFRYGEFKTAGEVGLKIPTPERHILEVPMDETQEKKYDSYIAQYTTALDMAGRDKGESARALGLLARMSLVSVHGDLDEAPDEAGWSGKNYREVKSFSSPKLAKIAELVSLRPTCGHLIFLENTVVHYWLREVLVSAGIPRERIALMSGEMTPTPLSRQRVADGFTSDTPDYDVVIANRVAYEGLNLQVRTCAIYHGDLPWEPATLLQRDGRGLRQGNKYDVIEIYYILSARSMDMARFELIRGKREWMAELLESAASETNNPAAQANMSPEEWLVFLSRDKEKTRMLLEERKAKLKAESDARTVKVAWGLVRSIALRQRDLLSADMVMRTQIHEQIAKIAEELGQVDGDVWAWKFVIPHIMRHPVLSFAPKGDGAIWSTARYTTKDYGGRIGNQGEFGRVIYEPRWAIGYRRAGRVKWEELAADDAHTIWENTRPEHWQEPWPKPLRDEIAGAMDDLLREIKEQGVWVFRQARFDLATEEFRETLALELPRIAEGLRQSEYYYQVRVPIVKDGVLIDDPKELTSGGLIPFTAKGYEEFLRLARTSKLKWTDLNSIADWWWGRTIPRNLLSEADRQLKAA